MWVFKFSLQHAPVGALARCSACVYACVLLCVDDLFSIFQGYNFLFQKA